MTAERVMDRRSAADLRVIDRKVVQMDRTAAWKRVHRLGRITETSAVVGRPEWAEQAGAELQALAARQLRMLRNNGEGEA